MKQLLFCMLIIVSVVACKSKDKDKSFDKVTYEQTKETLEDKERNNPLKFLQVSGHDHKNLFTFGKTVIKGEVSNSATVISYKDVRVKMLCYNKEGRMVEEHEDVLDETVQPNSSIKFKTKYHLPRGTDSIALSVMSAVAVSNKK